MNLACKKAKLRFGGHEVGLSGNIKIKTIWKPGTILQAVQDINRHCVVPQPLKTLFDSNIVQLKKTALSSHKYTLMLTSWLKVCNLSST